MNAEPASRATDAQSVAFVLRLLAVDDDPAEFTLLEDGFARCGTAVELLTATSAPFALAELMLGGPDGRPHAALIDVNMPLVSGFDLATHLIREGVPTILMSNHVNGERATRASGLGVLDLLTKPTGAQGYAAFTARVLRVLRSARVL